MGDPVRFLVFGLLAIAEVGCTPLGTDDICVCPPIAADGGGPPGFDATFADAPDATDGSTATPRVSLCEIVACDPDNPTVCGNQPDAGDAAVLSCRVDGAHAQCVAAGAGTDGESCASGADCAPGFDCVGSGVCREYCCGGACSETFFCDLGATSSMAIVPVCSPVQACTPLTPGSCASGEACTVVQINGQLAATCDAAGVGQRGDSCETALCASGFACLGAVGSRTCEQMCNTANACPVSLTCDLTSVGVGVCE
jgi:hypothetical protein